jgi:hypothetical protein
MYLFVLHLHKVAAHLALCRDNRYLQMPAPVLKGRLRKWMFTLSEFDIRYQPTKAVKG